MQGKRSDRIGELIRAELGSVISTRLRDPRVGFVTITHVDVSADMKHAKVFYSVMGQDRPTDSKASAPDVQRETQEALGHARGFLQRELAHALNLRNTPHLNFLFDDSTDRSMEIEGILNRIHNEEQSKDKS